MNNKQDEIKPNSQLKNISLKKNSILKGKKEWKTEHFVAATSHNRKYLNYKMNTRHINYTLNFKMYILSTLLFFFLIKDINLLSILATFS